MFKILKEKLIICWKLFQADQYIFCGYKGDMKKCFQNRKKNLSCYTSEPLFPMIASTTAKMLKKLENESNKKWELVGQKIFSFEEFKSLLDNGVYLYETDPDKFQNKEQREVVKKNFETDKYENYKAGKDTKMLSEHSAETLKADLYDTAMNENRIFYYLQYEEIKEKKESKEEN